MPASSNTTSQTRTSGRRKTPRAPADEPPEAAPHHAGRLVPAPAVLVITLLCAGLYAWTADFPMVFDDEMYMKNNPIFKDARSFSYPLHLTEFACFPARAGADPDLAVNFMMRPAAYATLWLNYAFDGFNPRWYRAVNIVIHALNSVLVFALLRLLLWTGGGSPAPPHGSRAFIPTVAALLFAAHPLATESVTYIVQRFTSLSAFFFLLTLCVFFAALRAASRRRAAVLKAAAVASLLAGMFTKECTFTAPVVAVLLDWGVNATPPLAVVRRARPLLLCLPVIPAMVVIISMAMHAGTFSLDAAINIVNSRENPLEHWHYLVSQITVVAAYLGRIFWPAGLNLDPDWPLHRSLLEPAVLRALAALAAVVVGAVWLGIARRADVRARIAAVFTLWFFITISASSGIVPLPDLMADHRTYLPSVGVFVAVAALLDMLRTSSGRFARIVRPAVPAAALACVAALSWATCARNEVWRTSVSLWTDTAEKSPQKYRVWGNLGAALSNAGREEEAVRHFQKAIGMEPRFQHGMFNLSNSLLRLGRPQESLDASVKLIRLDERAARQPHVVFTVALGLAGVGRYDEAIAIYKDILAVMPDYANCHQALGSAYLQTNQPALALEHYRTAARLKVPDKLLLECIKLAENALAGSGPSSEKSGRPFQLR